MNAQIFGFVFKNGKSLDLGLKVCGGGEGTPATDSASRQVNPASSSVVCPSSQSSIKSSKAWCSSRFSWKFELESDWVYFQRKFVKDNPI